MEKSKVYDIQKRSDFVNDVLERTPNWIITWGNTYFLLFLLLLVALAAFIKYPDIINARTIITLANPPISVVTEKSGELERIYYSDKELVAKEAPVLKIFSLAQLEDVSLVREKLVAFNDVSSIHEYLSFYLPTDLELGSLASTYSTLQKDYQNFMYFLTNTNTSKKVASLEREIEKIRALNHSLTRQEAIFREEFNLAKKNYDRSVLLNQRGAISDLEREREESAYLTQKRQLENFNVQKINNELLIEEKQAHINDLLGGKNEDLDSQANALKEQSAQLLEQIKYWEKQHLIKAPIAGRISLDERIVEQYYVNKKEVVFDIIPEGENKIIGRAEMPIINSGEIQTGDKVQIRLDAYPYQEYGFIESKIQSISLLPKQIENATFITAELELPDTLKTVYGRAIPLIPNMTATALIVKEDKTLLARIFDRISLVFQG